MKSMIAFFAFACLLAVVSAQVLLHAPAAPAAPLTWAAPGHIVAPGYGYTWTTAENTLLPAASILYKK